MAQTPDAERPAGMTGFVKAIAVIAIVALALFGALFVFDVISREMLGEAFVKVLLLAGIVIVAAVAIAAVVRSGR